MSALISTSLRADYGRAFAFVYEWRFLVGLANIPRGPRGLPIAFTTLLRESGLSILGLQTFSAGFVRLAGPRRCSGPVSMGHRIAFGNTAEHYNRCFVYGCVPSAAPAPKAPSDTLATGAGWVIPRAAQSTPTPCPPQDQSLPRTWYFLSSPLVKWVKPTANKQDEHNDQ
eukprot:scaffold13326_cov127-Isochrysis_galbana.AAC.5